MTYAAESLIEPDSSAFYPRPKRDATEAKPFPGLAITPFGRPKLCWYSLHGEFIVEVSGRGATVSSSLLRGGVCGKVGKGMWRRSQWSMAAS
jgi:hypothetical protein